MRTVFVHDWLDTFRGGEKVLSALLELDPQAPVYTLFYNPEKLPVDITSREIHDHLLLSPFKKYRKLLLPLLPAAVAAFDLSDFDLIVSSSSCVAKGARGGKNTKHLCYIHSPMRYIWDQQEHYLKSLPRFPFFNQAVAFLTQKLRRWDVDSCKYVDQFIVNSHFVADRVSRFYGRNSRVIHPPIEDRFFNVTAIRPQERQDFFLAAGAFVPYKRFDLAVSACKAINQKLIIAGSGPLYHELKKAESELITVIDSPSDQELEELLKQAKALIFPGVEDFGLLPVEAMACGTPVIAYGKGGALDYTLPGKTGLLFTKDNTGSLEDALSSFKPTDFSVEELQLFAQNFSRSRFIHRMQDEIEKLVVKGSTHL